MIKKDKKLRKIKRLVAEGKINQLTQGDLNMLKVKLPIENDIIEQKVISKNEQVKPLTKELKKEQVKPLTKELKKEQVKPLTKELKKEQVKPLTKELKEQKKEKSTKK